MENEIVVTSQMKDAIAAGRAFKYAEQGQTGATDLTIELYKLYTKRIGLVLDPSEVQVVTSIIRKTWKTFGEELH